MAKDDSRLGKGLGALLDEYLDEPPASPIAAREVPLGDVRSNPFQPRQAFDESALDELAESIRLNGLLQPIIVRRAEEGWEIVAGERRWRALQRLGWESAPVIVRELTDEEMLVVALVENLQRSDLSPLEEARGYQQLMNGFGLSQRQVATHVGRNRSTVANALRLLGLPEPVQLMLADGRLTAGHARAVLSVENEAERVAVAEEIVARGLSVREAEKLVRQNRGDSVSSKRMRSRRSDADRDRNPTLRRVERELERALGTQAYIRTADGSRGEIRIAFHDADDLGRILALVLGVDAEELFERE